MCRLFEGGASLRQFLEGILQQPRGIDAAFPIRGNISGPSAEVSELHTRLFSVTTLPFEELPNFILRDWLVTKTFDAVNDFGLAKFLSADGEQSTLTLDTGAGQLLGATYYICPEQLKSAAASPGWDW
jgi:hypothetical protein